MSTVNQNRESEKPQRSHRHRLALALAALGIKVFPCRHQHEFRDGRFFRAKKSPLTPNGFHDATTDTNQIDDWWLEHPDALVGWVPHSVECAVLDLDNKNGKNGAYELERRELEYKSSLWYPTPSGGEHHVFREPWRRKVGPQRDYLGFHGVDVRSGGSYAIWYGEAPTSLDNIPELPKWVREGKRKFQSNARWNTGGSQTVDGQRNFGGDLREWFDWLGNEPPWWVALRIEEEVASLHHVGHDDLVRLTWRIHHSRLSGVVGLGPVALQLVEKFRTTTNNHDGWRRELEDAIRGAIGVGWSRHTDALPDSLGVEVRND
jgi:hypothetical protein